MKRRRFMRALVAAPAIPAVLAQQAAPQAAQQTTQQANPPSTPAPPAGRGGRGGGTQAVSNLEVTAPDLAAEGAPSFFTADQFAALRKLGDTLMPPLKGRPGALEAGAPEFLDFLVKESPADRQKLYRGGLDALNVQARKQYKKAFAELDAAEAGAIVKPLLVVINWPEDRPADPVKHFVAQAHRDFRTATQNSREWATAGSAAGRRGGRGSGGGTGLYWLPIDPVYKG